MELPEDVVQIIREYSKPVTRPDWRTLHKMPFIKYKENVILYILEIVTIIILIGAVIKQYFTRIVYIAYFLENIKIELHDIYIFLFKSSK